MCEDELFKHQFRMFNLLKAYMSTWEQHQQYPQDRSHVLELRRLLRNVRDVDAKQKQLVQQVRLKRLYERQQERDRSSASLPSSPQACSPSSSSSSGSSHRNACEEDPPSPRLRSLNAVTTLTPSFGGSDSTGDTPNIRPPPPPFLEPDNLYLWEAEHQCTQEMEEEEPAASWTPAGNASESNSGSEAEGGDAEPCGVEEDVLCSAEQPWSLATEEEFLQYFGMLPSRHLQEVMEKRALRRQANRHKLFFALGASERRDSKRKKKYLSTEPAPRAPLSRGCSPPSGGASGGEGDASRPATPVDEVEQRLLLAPRNTCAACGTNEDVDSTCTRQCGGCGEWYHPGCSSAAEAPVATHLGEEWLCGGCLQRGIRASVVHDALLLRSLRLASERRIRDGKSGQRKGDSRSRKAAAVRRTAAATDKKAADKRREVVALVETPPPPPPPLPATPMSAGAATSMKTRGSANRRPPAKYLSPPAEAPAAARQLRPVNQLTLATKFVKVSSPVNRGGPSYTPGVSAASGNKRAGCKTGQGTLGRASNIRNFEANIGAKDMSGSGTSLDAVRISKSARINLTKISASSVKSNLGSSAVRVATCKIDSPGEGEVVASGSLATPVIKTRNVTSRSKVAVGGLPAKKTVSKDTSLVKVFKKILHNKSGL